MTTIHCTNPSLYESLGVKDMPEAIRKVNVIGHLHPDTDSICAAISYAYLKNQIDEPIYEARRAGALNR